MIQGIQNVSFSGANSKFYEMLSKRSGEYITPDLLKNVEKNLSDANQGRYLGVGAYLGKILPVNVNKKAVNEIATATTSKLESAANGAVGQKINYVESLEVSRFGKVNPSEPEVVNSKGFQIVSNPETKQASAWESVNYLG